MLPSPLDSAKFASVTYSELDVSGGRNGSIGREVNVSGTRHGEGWRFGVLFHVWELRLVGHRGFSDWPSPSAELVDGV